MPHIVSHLPVVSSQQGQNDFLGDLARRNDANHLTYVADDFSASSDQLRRIGENVCRVPETTSKFAIAQQEDYE